MHTAISNNGKHDAAATTENIEIKGMDLRVIQIPIVGESPLIMHRWSEKAKRQMRDKQQKKATKAKEVRNPHEEFIEATYFLNAERTRYGFPATAFYNA